MINTRAIYNTLRLFRSKIRNLNYTRSFSSQEITEDKNTIFHPNNVLSELRKMTREFTRDHVEPQANEYNEKEMFNFELFQKMGELGLLGTTIPEEYGGCGLGATAACIMLEEVSYSDPGFGLSVLAHSLLFGNNLAVNGNEEQKMKYLPSVCTGHIFGGMALTEPSCGTDIINMKTNSKIVDDQYIINGAKTFITNGHINKKDSGDAFLVYAQGTKPKKLSLFIVDKQSSGWGVTRPLIGKLGCRASPTAELYFQNVKVPKTNLVGEDGGAVYCMMRNLEIERLGLAAQSIGIARRCLNEMIQYSQSRVAFGQNLHAFGQIQDYIATSYAEYYAGKSYLYNIANNHDLTSYNNRIDTDAVKLFCAKMAKNVADRSIQVLGGTGYFGESVVERLWRDSKLFEIGGGTNEAHQKNITRDLIKSPILE